MNAIEQNLERSYNLFINRTTLADFFKGLAHYLEYVYEVPILKEVMEGYAKERDKGYVRVNELEEKTVQELNEVKDKLLKVIKRRKIDANTFERFDTFSYGDGRTFLEEFEGFQKGLVRPSGFYSTNLQRYLFDICANLKRLGYENDIKEYIFDNKSYADYWRRVNGDGQYIITGNTNGNFIFSKTMPERYEAEAVIERNQETKVDGAFENLLKFKRAYEEVSNKGDYSSLLGEREGVGLTEIRDAVDITQMAVDLKKLLVGNHAPYTVHYTQGQLSHIPIEKFRIDSQTVHNKLMQRLSFQEEIPKKKLSNSSQIKEITFIEKKTKPKPAYSFYINGNLDDVKLLRGDSNRIRKLIGIIKNESKDYDKSLLDYINSNKECALYCAGKYELTKILEKRGQYLDVCYGIKAKVINEKEYRSKLNKKSSA